MMTKRTRRLACGFSAGLALLLLALPMAFLLGKRNTDIPVGYGAVRLMVLTGPARHAVYGRLPGSGFRTIEEGRGSRWWCMTLGASDYHVQWFGPRLSRARRWQWRPLWQVGGSMKNRKAWALATVLAGGLLGGVGLTGFWLRSYWVAKYRGRSAYLEGALLIRAPLQGAMMPGANLRRANLAGADLRQACLSFSSLSGANLRGANLTRTFLDGTSLRGSDFSGANLTRTVFDGANLRGAKLSGARLTGARFVLANLRGVDLRHVDLRSTLLIYADLRGADLLGAAGRLPADLSGARYDAQTRWPQGFDPARHGAVRVR
jgi:uncharacterized protein YjbI with pentapeptide repeats